MADGDRLEIDLAGLNEHMANALGEFLGRQGAVLSGFVMSVDLLDSDGADSWCWAFMPGQRLLTTSALARWMMRLAEHEEARYLGTIDE